MTGNKKPIIAYMIDEYGETQEVDIPATKSDAQRLGRLLDLLTDETHRTGYTIGGLDINDLRALANTTNQTEHEHGNLH